MIILLLVATQQTLQNWMFCHDKTITSSCENYISDRKVVWATFWEKRDQIFISPKSLEMAYKSSDKSCDLEKSDRLGISPSPFILWLHETLSVFLSHDHESERLPLNGPRRPLFFERLTLQKMKGNTKLNSSAPRDRGSMSARSLWAFPALRWAIPAFHSNG